MAKGEEGSLDALRFVCEYAKSGRSTCKASKQAIAQGALRIGKVVENPWAAGKEMSLWYIPEALFDSFRKGKSGKTYLTSEDDLEGAWSFSSALCILSFFLELIVFVISLAACPQQNEQGLTTSKLQTKR